MSNIKEYEIDGVKFFFRKIPAGQFLMGSPESEKGRWNDETLHIVTLDGFWMAETACTQALWEAITDKNPSAFNGKELPVECVSWDDCQQFITQLNQRIPTLEARLPSEAEWEYACRAGTQTPFSFGENISTDQANYDGSPPYHNGEKGIVREKTVSVCALPSNDWGLYQMHGNVLEWCQDYYQDDLGTDEQQNPQGPTKGTDRVLRGGSWDFSGRVLRSACRGRGRPAVRSWVIGFRLALDEKIN